MHISFTKDQSAKEDASVPGSQEDDGSYNGWYNHHQYEDCQRAFLHTDEIGEDPQKADLPNNAHQRRREWNWSEDVLLEIIFFDNACANM